MRTEWMDTVDPRLHQTKTGHHRRVHVPSYTVRWGVSLTLAIAAAVAIVIWA